MIKKLEGKGFITKERGKRGVIELLLERDEIPDLE